MPFHQLGLNHALEKAVKALNYEAPTPIQAQTIPLALQGRDVLGCAQTGGGKTAAFALPILHHLLEKPGHGVRALVLVPTRELAVQVEKSFRDCAQFTPVKVAAVIGGTGYDAQLRAVREGAQVIIATPGRLLDHLERRNFTLNAVEHLVLDEADRMLDMGFLPDIKAVLSQIPRRRQTQLFSATLHAEVEKIAAFATHDPVRVEISRPSNVAEGITQILYPVAQSQKSELLLALLSSTEMKSVLVFTRTKHGADRVARRLEHSGYRVGRLHSNRSQNQRMQAMEDFRHRRSQILVATDIAARGIDVKDISHVVNFDVPRHPEDYVHRVGRTARNYGVGDAVTLMDPSEESFVRDIERFTKIVFPRAMLPTFNYQKTPAFFQGQRPDRGGQRPQRHQSHQSHGQSHPHGQHGQHRPPRQEPQHGQSRPPDQRPQSPARGNQPAHRRNDPRRAPRWR